MTFDYKEHRILRLILLSIAIFAFMFCYVGVYVILTPFAVELGADLAFAGFIFGMVPLTLSVSMIILGILADRVVGIKIAILIGCFILFAGTFLCGTAADGTQLVIYRFISGIGLGALGLFAPAFLRLFSRPKASVALGFYFLPMGLGGFIGSLATGIIAAQGYRIAFYAVATTGLVAGILGAIGATKIIHIKPKENEMTEQPKRSVAKIFLLRNVALISIGGFIGCIGWMAASGFIPLMALDLGATTSIVGLTSGLLALPTAFMGPISGFLGCRFGNRNLAVIGCAALTAMSLVTAYAYFAGSLELLIASVLLLGIAMGFLGTPANTVAQNSVERQEQGRVGSILAASGNLPGALMYFIGAYIMILGYTNLFILCAGLTAIEGVLYAMTKEPKSCKADYARARDSWT